MDSGYLCSFGIVAAFVFVVVIKSIVVAAFDSVFVDLVIAHHLDIVLLELIHCCLADLVSDMVVAVAINI